jgi:hypothetical protein
MPQTNLRNRRLGNRARPAHMLKQGPRMCAGRRSADLPGVEREIDAPRLEAAGLDRGGDAAAVEPASVEVQYR